MLVISRGLYTGENLKQIIRKKQRKLWTLFTIISNLVPTCFNIKYIRRTLLARLIPLQSKTVDKYRNGKLSKMGLLLNFLYTFTINCVTTGAQKLSIVYMFRVIRSKHCIKLISSRYKCVF